TLNALLDAEAEALCNARRYERSPDRTDYRAGSYRRPLHTKAGAVELKVPKLRRATFESHVIERYRQVSTITRPDGQGGARRVVAAGRWQRRDGQGAGGRHGGLRGLRAAQGQPAEAAAGGRDAGRPHRGPAEVDALQPRAGARDAADRPGRQPGR